jgi:AraC-like DNA-binding protein
MRLIFRAPQGPLAPFVEHVWDCVSEPGPLAFERILPIPRASLIINLQEDETRGWHGNGFDVGAMRCVRAPGAVLVGPYTRSFVIDTAEQTAVMGVSFHAGGAAPFLRERMDALSDRDTGLEDILGQSARSLRESLLDTADAEARLDVLEAWLLRRIGSARTHGAVTHALGLLHASPRAPRMDDIARTTGLSPRRFGTLFREHVGLAPKRYARALRFFNVVRDVHASRHVDWAAVAADCGFSDQPHLVHEFRAFSGMTPGEYLARRGIWANHVPV